MRRPTVLSLPTQLAFPGFSYSTSISGYLFLPLLGVDLHQSLGQFLPPLLQNFRVDRLRFRRGREGQLHLVDVVLVDNVIKLFTMVIYHHSTVIPSFCVIKLYYLGNYCGMAVNYCGILTLEKVGLELLQ